MANFCEFSRVLNVIYVMPCIDLTLLVNRERLVKYIWWNGVVQKLQQKQYVPPLPQIQELGWFMHVLSEIFIQNAVVFLFISQKLSPGKKNLSSPITESWWQNLENLGYDSNVW